MEALKTCLLKPAGRNVLVNLGRSLSVSSSLAAVTMPKISDGS